MAEFNMHGQHVGNQFNIGNTAEYMLQVSETVHKHMARYSEELQGKLGDVRRAYQSPDTYGQEVIDVLRHQVKVLEARMDTLRDLDEDIQAIVKKALGH